MNFDKYNPLQAQKATILEHWSESEPVSNLRAFLIDVKPYGIELGVFDGRIGLRFVPGIGKEEKERMLFAQHATNLLVAASRDLHALWHDGSIALRSGSFLKPGFHTELRAAGNLQFQRNNRME